tara:strand:+ start:144 stop:392 length:249 start_codon:yes stop_codon:yes gene_type:complete
MDYTSIKTTVEIKSIEIDIEVYYEAYSDETYGGEPNSISIEIQSINRQGSLKKVSNRLRDKILELYENTIDNYIAEDFEYGR